MTHAGSGGAPLEYDPFAGPALLAAVPSTEPQREIWLAAKLGDDASLAYNESWIVSLRGPLDVPALEGALADLVARHESMRASFSDDGMTMYVGEAAPPRIDLLDLSDRSPSERDAALRDACSRAVTTPFDLERGPLFRVALVRFGADEHHVVFSAHHIVVDGWSSGLLVSEWAVLYSARVEGRPADLPPADAFSDYARHEASPERAAENAAHEAYWVKQFAGEIPILELPTDRPRPARKTFSADRKDFVIDLELTKRVKRAGAKAGASFFTTLLAAFDVLLYRLSGQEDLVVGVPAAGQSSSGRKNLVGHCVNTLPVRARIDGARPFRDLARDLQASVLDAFEHQDLTFGAILKKLPIARDPSRQPLVSVTFNLDQALPEDALRWSGLTATFATNPRTFESFDLFVNALEGPRGLVLECQYNTDLFDEATITRWLAGYERLLEGIAADPTTAGNELPLLSDDDRRLLDAWNAATTTPYDRERTVHDLVREQAARTPQAIALTQGDVHLRFAEIDERSEALAAYLRAQGAAPGARVGLYLERTPELVVGLVAILKSGAAYVPLDPSYPADRLAYMVEDARIEVLVTQRSLAGRLTARSVVCIDEPLPAASPAPEIPAGPEDPAYVIYTSGSTGKPKGVVIPHRAVVNFLESFRRDLALTERDTILAVTTLSFDIAVLEIWLPLAFGARIVLADRDTATDGLALQRVMRNEHITHLQATPATWRLLIEAGWTGDPNLTAICGGEAMPKDLAAQLAPCVRVLWNAYGPTETTVWSTLWKVPREPERVLIGRPIANTQIYIWDAHRKDVPVGVVGEIYIGGDGVTLGYHDRPELTAERFVPDPNHAGARVYRTGDLGRFLRDGTIECLGRNDHQVKVRGFRIELGEIEAALASHERVRQAAVTTRELRAGDIRLVAYVVPEGATPEDEVLRAHLRRALPEYMVPQHFVSLPKLPLTPSGKVDRKALPTPVAEAAAPREGLLEPRTEMERVVARAFETVLGLPRVDVRDNFFELGGHSLLAAQLAARLSREHGLAVSIRTLFEAPTIERLAKAVERPGASVPAPAVASIPRRSEQNIVPATSRQARLWFLQQAAPEQTALNVASSFRLRGRLNIGALERALNEIRARHAPLRTTFELRDEGLWQRVDPIPDPFSLASPIDLRDVPAEKRDDALHELLRRRIREPFDLAHGPLVRVALIKLGEEDHVLSLVAHHIVWDGWSFDIYRHELDTLYRCFCEGRPSSLPPLPISYGDYAAWQIERTSGPELERELSFWKAQLAGDLEPLDFPSDRPRPAVRTDGGDGVWMRISRAEADRITQVARRYECTPFMLLLSAFQVLIHRYTGQTDVRIGNAARGRSHPDVQDLIGFFVNTLVLRARVDPHMKFSELLGHTRAVTLDAFGHEEMPFDVLVRELQVPRDPSRTPLVQHLFSFQDGRAREGSIGDLALSLVPVQLPSAQTDLTVWFVETDSGLNGAINYSTDLFDAPTIERMVAHYRCLLDAILANPETPVCELAMLTDDERRLLERWNDTGLLDRGDLPVHALFDEVARARPDAIAVVHGDQRCTYAELERRSNQLAHSLARHGALRNTIVGHAVERSIDSIAALLGILKAGGAYLALDGRYPSERLRYMLEDAKVKVLVTTESAATPFAFFGGRIVRIDADAADLANERTDPPPMQSHGDDLAYVAYTSGSTGGPKGVLIPHRAVHRLVKDAGYVDLTPDTKLLHAAPLAFDASTFEIWGALLNGGCVVLHPEDVPTPAGLRDTISRHGVCTAWLTAGLFNAVIDEDPTALAGLRRLLIGGEALSPPHVRKAYDHLHDTQILNGYGPTECTTFTTVHAIPRTLHADARSVPIGRPIRDTRAFVLDGQRRLAPIGVVGELYVGGAGLAHGYLGQPALTAEKFVTAPAAPGERLYRTGDLVRWLPDGALDFVGRNDTQVKVRGFRIELGEIESALAMHPGVRQAAVVAQRFSANDVRLVAYVSPHGAAIDEAALRASVAKTLPEYMVPRHFVTLDEIPLTPNGKVDRTALSRIEIRKTAAPASPDREERSPTEILLSQIMADLLGVAQLGPHDDFYELGGHSFLAMRLAAKVRETFGVQISIASILTSATVRNIAGLISRAGEATGASGLLTLRAGTRSPVFIMHDLVGLFGHARNLAERLAPDHPVYCILLPERDGAPYTFETMEEHAQYCVQRILATNRPGPYHLIGYSFGGKLAFETARQLDALGHPVGMVAIIDTAAALASAKSLRRILASSKDLAVDAFYLAYYQLLRTKPKETFAKVRARLRRAVTRASREQVVNEWIAGMDLGRLPAAYTDVARMHVQSAGRYREPRYRGRVTLVRARRLNVFQIPAPDLGWGAVADQGVDVRIVPGDHWDILGPDTIDAVCQFLNQTIAPP